MKLCRGTQNFAYRGEPWGGETAGEAEFGVRLPDGALGYLGFAA